MQRATEARMEKKARDAVDLLFDSIARLMKRSEQVITKDKERARLRHSLLNDLNRPKIIRGFKAVEMVREIAKGHKDHTDFFNVLHGRIDEIREYNPELAALISQLVEEEGVSPVISRILLIFMRYPKERVYVHFSRYRTQYSRRLLALKNREIATKVSALIAGFLEEYEKRQNEVKSVRVFADEVVKWNGANGQIKDYVAEAKRYVGSLRSLNDKGINSLLDMDDIKQILVYEREIIFLEDVYKRVASALSTLGSQKDTWGQFLNVYSSMKGIIRALRDRYSDTETAEELWGCYNNPQKFGQQPEPWEGRFRNILGRLKHQQNAVRKIRENLLKLFDNVLNRLNSVSEAEFSQTKDGVSRVVKGIKKLPRQHRRKLLKAVDRLEKESKKKLEMVRKQYDKSESYCYSSTAKSFYSLHNDLNRIEPEKRLMEIKKILDKKMPLYQRGIWALKAVNPERPGASAEVSNYILDCMARESELKAEHDDTKQKGIQELMELRRITEELDRVLPLFEKQLDVLISYLERVLIKGHREEVEGEPEPIKVDFSRKNQRKGPRTIKLGTEGQGGWQLKYAS